MTNIVEIVDQINLKEEMEKSKDKCEIEWKPEECTDYCVPTFEVPSVRTKKCTEETLSKVLAFIDWSKYKRLAHGCTIMPIPSTNKRLIDICGSQRQVSNLIKFMCKIGLLEIASDKYQYNAFREKYNQSKKYKYFYDNERKIIEYCKERGIIKKILKDNYDMHIHTVVEKFRIEDFDEEQVRFSSKLKLVKPSELSKMEFEAYLTSILYVNYPELAYYQKMADYINDRYYADDERLAIHFRPNFTWNKKNTAVRKIGIRATNSYVSAKGEKDENSSFNGYYKVDILKQYDLNLEKDVSSSVPRITLSLNTGKWITEEVDIYERIYDAYILRKNEIEGVSFKGKIPTFDKVRAAIKKLHMRGYFDEEKMIGVHTRRVMAEVKNAAEVDDEMKLYQKAIISAEGGYLYGSEIFYHESCIYMEVLKDLLGNGYKVWQCYDAWYAAKDGITQEEFQEYVTELVADKANEYISRQCDK